MGLPTSREGPIGSHAPVTSARIGAIEDSIIGHKRPQFTRPFVPVFCLVSSGSFVPAIATVGAHPIQKTNGAGPHSAFFAIPFEDGDRISGLHFDAYGNGTVAIVTAQVQWAGSMASALSAIGNLTGGPSVPAAWTTFNIGTPGAFAPKALSATDALYGFLTISAGAFEIGTVVPVFDRL